MNVCTIRTRAVLLSFDTESLIALRLPSATLVIMVRSAKTRTHRLSAISALGKALIATAERGKSLL